MSALAELKVAKHGGNLFLRAIGWLSTLCGIVAALLIIGAILVTCQMLYVRYWQGLSTIWQTETVTFMMVAATMIGLPYVQRLRGHVNVDLIPLMLPTGARKALAVLVLTASIVVIGLMVWHGAEMVHYAIKFNDSTNSAWDPRLWPIYLTVPVGLGLLGLQLFADLVALLLGIEEPFNLDAESTEGAE